ncbi:hypothetical protein RvY_18689 [Ramazzottius varieornatus]|uniref:MARVEL domain-containing protein n=1 Tax=Ramazzottius varieornatus TaxID=947166 RepID=A0A1D1W6P1_RAMVA|nr:hypothetical protein RvY_18689 [Ramazzottius varieornatus]
MGDHGVLRPSDDLASVVTDSTAKYRSAIYILGVIQVLLGIGALALELAALIMFYETGAPGYPIEYAGIWAGIFAIVTGMVQLLAGKKTVTLSARRKLFTVSVFLALISTIQAMVMFSLTAYNIYIVRREITRREGNQQPVGGTNLNLDQLKDLAMMRSVVALVYISLAIIAMISLVLDCCNACGKTSAGADDVAYTSVGQQVKQIRIFKKGQNVKA